MKKFFLAAVALFALNTTLSAQNLPNARIQNEMGRIIETQSLVDHKTPFILSFWSTTCKPCIKELDSMAENYEDWNDECPFRIVAISIDDSRSVARAKALARARGWEESFVLGYDINSDFKRALNVVSVPQVFVFDKHGKMIESHTGYTPGNEFKLFDKIKSLK